jgi:hypothetical protein
VRPQCPCVFEGSVLLLTWGGTQAIRRHKCFYLLSYLDDPGLFFFFFGFVFIFWLLVGFV